MIAPRERPWFVGDESAGRVVAVTRNPVAEAIATIAEVVGREVVLVAEDEDGAGIRAVKALDLRASDAVVLCDHDAPDAPALLRAALVSGASYVAMLASRRRSQGLLADLRSEGYDEELARLHVPAGLDTGGKSPGEIALSVVAEIVACSYHRPGGRLRGEHA